MMTEQQRIPTNPDCVRKLAQIAWADPRRPLVVEMAADAIRRDGPRAYKLTQEQADQLAADFVEQTSAELRRMDLAANAVPLQ